MKFGISFKMSIMAVAMIIITVGTVVYLFYSKTNDILIIHEVDKLSKGISLHAIRIKSSINSFQQDGLDLFWSAMTKLSLALPCYCVYLVNPV